MARELKKSTIISDKTVKPKSKVEDHYVDNKALYQALLERKENGTDEISDFIGRQLINIANGLAQKHNFRNYIFLDRMISEAIEKCVYAARKFDPEKSDNPFAYFTTTCYFAFISIIKLEKKELYIKMKSSLESLSMGELADISNNDSTTTKAMMSNLDIPQDYIMAYVNDYEVSNDMVKKEATPRKKRKRDTEGNTSEDFF